MKSTHPCRVLAALTSTLVLVAVQTGAQEEEDQGPQKWGDDAKYVTIAHVDFKPGRREEGLEIISEFFMPANEQAGVPGPSLVVHFQTGEWDVMAVWELEGGTADLEWYISPDDAKWYAALAEIAGGEEEAEAVFADWSDTIAHQLVELGHYHTGEE